ncbi:hypothetical protein CLOM_g1781, partial [Closterium sp. NIES-68]
SSRLAASTRKSPAASAGKATRSRTRGKANNAYSTASAARTGRRRGRRQVVTDLDEGAASLSFAAAGALMEEAGGEKADAAVDTSEAPPKSPDAAVDTSEAPPKSPDAAVVEVPCETDEEVVEVGATVKEGETEEEVEKDEREETLHGSGKRLKLGGQELPRRVVGRRVETEQGGNVEVVAERSQEKEEPGRSMKVAEAQEDSGATAYSEDGDGEEKAGEAKGAPGRTNCTEKVEVQAAVEQTPGEEKGPMLAPELDTREDEKEFEDRDEGEGEEGGKEGEGWKEAAALAYLEEGEEEDLEEGEEEDLEEGEEEDLEEEEIEWMDGQCLVAEGDKGACDEAEAKGPWDADAAAIDDVDAAADDMDVDADDVDAAADDEACEGHRDESHDGRDGDDGCDGNDRDDDEGEEDVCAGERESFLSAADELQKEGGECVAMTSDKEEGEEEVEEEEANEEEEEEEELEEQSKEQESEAVDQGADADADADADVDVDADADAADAGTPHTMDAVDGGAERKDDHVSTATESSIPQAFRTPALSNLVSRLPSSTSGLQTPAFEPELRSAVNCASQAESSAAQQALPVPGSSRVSSSIFFCLKIQDSGPRREDRRSLSDSGWGVITGGVKPAVGAGNAAGSGVGASDGRSVVGGAGSTVAAAVGAAGAVGGGVAPGAVVGPRFASSITSFVSLIKKAQPAPPPPASGKQAVQVKALAAAEAARLEAEQKAEERRQRRIALEKRREERGKEKAEEKDGVSGAGRGAAGRKVLERGVADHPPATPRGSGRVSVAASGAAEERGTGVKSRMGGREKRRRVEEAAKAKKEMEEKARQELLEKERLRKAKEEEERAKKAAEEEAKRQKRAEREREAEKRRKEEEQQKAAKLAEKEAERKRREEAAEAEKRRKEEMALQHRKEHKEMEMRRMQEARNGVTHDPAAAGAAGASTGGPVSSAHTSSHHPSISNPSSAAPSFTSFLVPGNRPPKLSGVLVGGGLVSKGPGQ